MWDGGCQVCYLIVFLFISTTIKFDIKKNAKFENIKKWPIHHRGIRRCYRSPMSWAQSSSSRNFTNDSNNSTATIVNECGGNNTTSKHPPTILQVGFSIFCLFMIVLEDNLLIKMLLRISTFTHTHTNSYTFTHLHSHYVTIIYFMQNV